MQSNTANPKTKAPSQSQQGAIHNQQEKTMNILLQNPLQPQLKRAILFSQSEKEIAERGNSFNLVKANSTPNRAFFVRNFRTPKENNRLKIELVAFPSMVERNGKGSPFAVCLTRRFSTPLRSTAQTVESLSGRLSKNLLVKDTAMLFKFLSIQNGKALKITVRADSEEQARIKHGISDTTLCVARYTDKFLSAKLALFPLSRSAKGAYYA